MCGRYERRGDKQKIAEAFYAKGGLDEVDFGEDFDCAPGSIQPIVWMNKEGEPIPPPSSVSVTANVEESGDQLTSASKSFEYRRMTLATGGHGEA
jgi:hypothetical protein